MALPSKATTPLPGDPPDAGDDIERILVRLSEIKKTHATDATTLQSVLRAVPLEAAGAERTSMYEEGAFLVAGDYTRRMEVHLQGVTSAFTELQTLSRTYGRENDDMRVVTGAQTADVLRESTVRSLLAASRRLRTRCADALLTLAREVDTYRVTQQHNEMSVQTQIQSIVGQLERMREGSGRAWSAHSSIIAMYDGKVVRTGADGPA